MHTFPTAAELLFGVIERGRATVRSDSELGIDVNRDRPEPSKFRGCVAILVHAADLTAILDHGIIDSVFVDGGGETGRTKDEGTALPSYQLVGLLVTAARTTASFACSQRKVANTALMRAM